MEMNVIVRHRLLAVRLSGDIDHHSAHSISTEIDREFMRRGVRNLAIDFSGTGFMDSSGIGLIMGRCKKVAAIGGKLFVYGMNSSIKRMLNMCCMEKIVIMADTADDIMEGLYR